MLTDSAASGEQLVILIVEDDAGLQRLVQKRLQRAGYRWASVHSGQEALQWLRTSEASLMLLDYTLPDMRGEELLDALASEQRMVPFVVATGNASASVAVDMMKRGARDYLIKSDETLDLLPSVLGRALDQVNKERALAAAQASLRESEKRYQTLLNVAPIGIVHCNRNGQCTYVNQQWSKISGLQFEDAVDESWMDKLHEDDRQRVIDYWQRTVKYGIPYHSEHRYIHPDGKTIWVMSRGLPQKDEQGRITGFVRTIVDITERKEMELALAASEELNRRIVESAPSGIVQAAPDGTFVKVNPAAFRIWGINQGETTYQRIKDFSAHTIGEDGSPFLADDYPLTRCLRTGKPQPAATIGVRKDDGTVSWAVYSAIPLFKPGTQEVSGAIVAFFDITAQKQTEQRLRQQNELLQTIFDRIPVMLSTWNERGLVLVNQEWENRLGWKLDEVRGLDSVGQKLFTDPDLLKQVTTLFYAAPPGWHDLPLRIRSGESIETVWAFVRLSDGTILSIGQDITERKRAEQERSELLQRAQAARAAAEESEANYRFLAEAIHQFVWTAPPSGETEYINQYWYDYTGLSRDMPVPDTWRQVVHPDDADNNVRIWARAAEKGEAFEMEYRVRHGASQQYRWFLGRVMPIKDERGVVIRWLGTALDVHDRYEAEMAQRESEARMRALAESLPFDVWGTDEQGRFAMQNGTSLKNWGDVHGKHLSEIDLPAEVAEQWRNRAEKALHGQQFQHEVTFDRDGIQRTYVTLLAPIRDGDKILGIVGANIDITERKEAEKRAHQLLSELAHVTRLSTMGTMASELAHEINQPLYAIANFAEASATMLRKTICPGQEDVLHWLQQISGQAKRAGEIVRGLGQFVRKSPTQHKPCDINSLIEEVIELLRVDAKVQQVALTLDLQPAPLIHVNRVQIQQIVANLVLNAVQAMQAVDPEKRTLTIQTIMRGEELVEVLVHDTGPGIPLELMDRLFEPYFTTKPNGMGMGLVISRSIIEAHDGNLWATSSEGVGTTFHFTLPLREKENI